MSGLEKPKEEIFNLQKFKRKMINALIRRPLTREEINRIMNDAYPNRLTNSNSRSVKRFLDNLIDYDLIHDNKESEKYVWKIKTKDHIDMVEHSLHLIPAFENLADMKEGRYVVTSQETAYISTKYMNFLESCAKEHLLLYPDISSLIKNHKEGNRAIEEMKDKFTQRLKMNLSDFLAENPMIESDNIVKIIPELIYEKLRYGNRNIINTLSGGIADFIERETGKASNLSEIKRINDIQTESIELKKELEDKMLALIFGILAKRKLRGGCKICEKQPSL